VNDLDDRLDDLRRLASVTAILDREGALRLYAVILALEGLTARLAALEVSHGLAAVERREDQHLNG
jgi:hypothetical protein